MNNYLIKFKKIPVGSYFRDPFKSGLWVKRAQGCFMLETKGGGRMYSENMAPTVNDFAGCGDMFFELISHPSADPNYGTKKETLHKRPACRRATTVILNDLGKWQIIRKEQPAWG